MAALYAFHNVPKRQEISKIESAVFWKMKRKGSRFSKSYIQLNSCCTLALRLHNWIPECEAALTQAMFLTISSERKTNLRWYFYQLPTKLRKGNVFAGVCLSTGVGEVMYPWYQVLSRCRTPPRGWRPLRRSEHILLECFLVKRVFKPVVQSKLKKPRIPTQ